VFFWGGVSHRRAAVQPSVQHRPRRPQRPLSSEREDEGAPLCSNPPGGRAPSIRCLGISARRSEGWVSETHEKPDLAWPDTLRFPRSSSSRSAPRGGGCFAGRWTWPSLLPLQLSYAETWKGTTMAARPKDYALTALAVRGIMHRPLHGEEKRPGRSQRPLRWMLAPQRRGCGVGVTQKRRT
jgi:hypothetical protein